MFTRVRIFRFNFQNKSIVTRTLELRVGFSTLGNNALVTLDSGSIWKPMSKPNASNHSSVADCQSEAGTPGLSALTNGFSFNLEPNDLIDSNPALLN